MKKAISLILVVLMFTSILSVSSMAAQQGTLPSNPIPVTYGQSYYGYWSKSNNHLNCYNRITVSKNGYININISKPTDTEGEMGAVELLLYDSNNNLIWNHNTNVEKNDIKMYYSYNVGLKKGTYILNIVPSFYVSSGAISFNYRVLFTADDYYEIESNNTVALATPINVNYAYSGSIGTTYCDMYDEYDYFKFGVVGGKKYRVTFADYSKLSSTSTMYTMYVNGKEIDDFAGYYFDKQFDSQGGNYCEFVAPSSGTAVFLIDNYIGTPVPYRFIVSGTAASGSSSGSSSGSGSTTTKPGSIATPKVSTTNEIGGVNVTWNKVSGAVKYNIYRRQGGYNTWTLVGTTTGNTFLDKNVKSGIYYVYSVRAYNASGKYSAFVSANTQTRKFMATPKLTTIYNHVNGLAIKWNAVSGITNGYRVYRRGAGSTYWTYLGTTKNLYFIDNEVKNNSGEYFRYTVIADGGYHSKFDTTGLYLMRLANPTLTSATSSSAGITVKWSAIKGTTGYYVYRKTANSNWVSVAAVGGTNTTSYLDKSAVKGTTYTYTVRAVYGSTTSAYNSGISCYDKY